MSRNILYSFTTALQPPPPRKKKAQNKDVNNYRPSFAQNLLKNVLLAPCIDVQHKTALVATQPYVVAQRSVITVYLRKFCLRRRQIPHADKHTRSTYYCYYSNILFLQLKCKCLCKIVEFFVFFCFVPCVCPFVQ